MRLKRCHRNGNGWLWPDEYLLSGRATGSDDITWHACHEGRFQPLVGRHFDPTRIERDWYTAGSGFIPLRILIRVFPLPFFKESYIYYWFYWAKRQQALQAGVTTAPDWRKYFPCPLLLSRKGSSRTSMRCSSIHLSFCGTWSPNTVDLSFLPSFC
jgi:hypothetical protein